MSTLKKCIATKSAAWPALLALCMGASFAYAAPVGTVTHLSGPLLDKKADGSVRVLSVQSTVEQGDTLVTQKDTYAQIKFTDDSQITLKPDTQFKIDSFSFEPEKKENDSAIFSLIKGGLREVTGLLGKRSKERFGLHTPTATIGIRGTIFIAQLQGITGEEAVTEPSDGGSTGGSAAAGGGTSSIAEGLNPSTSGGVTTGGGSTTTQPTADPSSGTGGDHPSKKYAPVEITIHKPGDTSSAAGGHSSASTEAGAVTGGGSTTTQSTTNPSSGSLPKLAPATSASAIPSSLTSTITPSPGAAPTPVPTTPRPEASVKPEPPESAGSGVPPGLYVQVQEGMINVSNIGGSQNFVAGQFGYVPALHMPPIILPNNPSLKFSPPPSFSSSTVGQGSNGESGKEGGVDCVVR